MVPARVLAYSTSAVRVGWYCEGTAVNLKCTTTRMIALSWLYGAELQRLQFSIFDKSNSLNFN